GVRARDAAAAVRLDEGNRELLAVLQTREQLGERLELARERQAYRHLAVRVDVLFLHHLRALDGDALLGGQRVRPLLERRGSQRGAAARKQAAARLLEPFLKALALGTQRIG